MQRGGRSHVERCGRKRRGGRHESMKLRATLAGAARGRSGSPSGPLPRNDPSCPTFIDTDEIMSVANEEADMSGTIWRFGALLSLRRFRVSTPAIAVLLALIPITSACTSSGDRGQAQPPSNTPTQLPPSPAASATSEEPIDSIITEFVLSTSVPGHVIVNRTTYYTDSSGTTWLRFGVLLVHDVEGEGVTDPGYGIMKKVPGGDWVGVSGPGTFGVECDLPPDVQTGLGFAICTSQPTPTLR